VSGHDSEALTGPILDRLRLTIRDMKPGDRPNFAAAQCTLWCQARWARSGVVNNAVSQIAKATRLSVPTVKRSLSALDRAGLQETITRGGGRHKVGTTRLLLLDYDGDGVPRPNPRADVPAHESDDQLVPSNTSRERSGTGPNSAHDAPNSTRDALNSAHPERDTPPSSAYISAPLMSRSEREKILRDNYDGGKAPEWITRTCKAG
jgi:hypothetical protein